jgi:hypothetical protein
MNQIEQLLVELLKRFPALTIEMNPPVDRERGTWHLDIERGDGRSPVIVEWRPDRGFGVSTPADDDYGIGPDKVYSQAKAAFDCIVHLVLSGGQTI